MSWRCDPHSVAFLLFKTKQLGPELGFWIFKLKLSSELGPELFLFVLRRNWVLNLVHHCLTQVTWEKNSKFKNWSQTGSFWCWKQTEFSTWPWTWLLVFQLEPIPQLDAPQLVFWCWKQAQLEATTHCLFSIKEAGSIKSHQGSQTKQTKLDGHTQPQRVQWVWCVEHWCHIWKWNHLTAMSAWGQITLAHMKQAMWGEVPNHWLFQLSGWWCALLPNVTPTKVAPSQTISDNFDKHTLMQDSVRRCRKAKELSVTQAHWSVSLSIAGTESRFWTIIECHFVPLRKEWRAKHMILWCHLQVHLILLQENNSHPLWSCGRSPVLFKMKSAESMSNLLFMRFHLHLPASCVHRQGVQQKHRCRQRRRQQLVERDAANLTVENSEKDGLLQNQT